MCQSWEQTELSCQESPQNHQADLRVSVVLPRQEQWAEAAYIHGLSVAAQKWPYAFSLNGVFGELERADATDAFRSDETVVLGHMDDLTGLNAAVLMSVAPEHVDIVDVYSNGPKGLGAAIFADALRYAATVREHVLVGVLAGNLAVGDLYLKVGFQPYITSREINYFYLGGRDAIEYVANLIARYGWRASGVDVLGKRTSAPARLLLESSSGF